MPREITPEMALKIAAFIVESWESIEQKAADFQARFGTSDEAREQIVLSMREISGGEEMYLASKAFLKEHADAK